MAPAFEAFVYSSPALADALARHSGARLQVVRDKPQTDYLANYLSQIGARTVVAELDYIDRDYLEDFAGYYVRCFEDYRRKCVRLHFFRHGFGENELARLLRHDVEQPLSLTTLQESYLGFVVVKPLPVTIVGRTCLVPYDSLTADEGATWNESTRSISSAFRCVQRRSLFRSKTAS